MNIENQIEFRYQELLSYSAINLEFLDLYKDIKHERLRDTLTTLHYDFISLFRTMNERLPTNEYEAHFWADPSRQLIKTIETTLGLYNNLKDSKYAFDVDKYYYDLINKCREFLSNSGGSKIPPNMDKIELYYKIPIFTHNSVINVSNPQNNFSYPLKLIGGGSYANVYKYKDTYYNKYFALKRARNDLTSKELERFKREFDEMNEFSSPYILDVYRYDVDKNEYIMEYMDSTLDEYISKNNSTLSISSRKGLVNQIFRAFEYIHSKSRLHRDISPKNILLKKYDDVIVAKISDFGLVKIPDSTLTSVGTEFKGYFNDPSLAVEGFYKYDILHETYALTRIVYYVMTGKTNTDIINNEKLKEFVNKGLNSDKTVRFKSVSEMIREFKSIT